MMIAARDLTVGQVVQGATVTAVDAATNPGVVYVELDYSWRLEFNHGEPVEVAT